MNQEQTIKLIEATLAGNAEAFSGLVQAHKTAVWAYVLSRVCDFDLAEDLCQETFLRAFERLDQLQDPRRFSGWLRAIAENVCLMWFRRLRRQDPLDKARPHHDEEDQVFSPPRPWYERELVSAALAGLSPDNAAAMTLHYCDGLTYRECAEFLDTTPKAVEGRVRRAKQNIKQRVIKMAKEVLAGGNPSEDFDDAVQAEVNRLVKTVGRGGKKEILAEAERRLEVLFSRNIRRLADVIERAKNETDLHAAAQMVDRLDLAGVGQAIALALGDDDAARLNALAAMPSTSDGRGLYLVMEAIHDSGLSDRHKARLLVDLVHRPTALRGLCPRFLLKRFGLDALQYLRLLLHYPNLALDRLTELLQAGGNGQRADPYLSRAFVAFGTLGYQQIMPWFEGKDRRLRIIALELAEKLGRAVRTYVLGLATQKVRADSADKLSLRPDPIVHIGCIDRAVFNEIGRKVAAIACHASGSVCLAAVSALGYFEDEVALEPLARAIARQEPRLSSVAARSLGWRLTPVRVQRLVSTLEEGSSEVKRSAEGALVSMRLLIENMQGISRQGSEHGWEGYLATQEALDTIVEALDDVRNRILLALQAAGMSGAERLWWHPLAEHIRQQALAGQRRQHQQAQTPFRRRARSYHEAHPESVVRGPTLLTTRQHWLGLAAGRLPEDKAYTERELNRLIDGVGDDYASIRRALVDQGWMCRTKSIYHLTDLGRRAMRMEHVLAKAAGH